jgi:hypothetical protein
VLRRIFGQKRDEVTESRRGLHNELRKLYFSPNVIRKGMSSNIRWAVHVE